MKKGFFITLEGPDGCGKTTQSKLLKEYLLKKGSAVLHTREPGGTTFAENLREIILNPRYHIFPMAELFLYEASRAQHTEEVIRPALRSKKTVICERYTDATYAYQGYGRGLDLSVIKTLNRIATAGLAPDLTIVLDIGVREGLARAKGNSRGKKGDRLERENRAFHERVRKGYFALAKKEPRRIKIVSAEGSIQEVRDRIRALVEKHV